MPFHSKAQQRKMHALAEEGKISKAKVAEFDQSTDFSHLPERARKKSGSGRAGNTDYLVVNTPPVGNDKTDLVKDFSTDGGDSPQSRYEFIEGTGHSQVEEIPVHVGNHVKEEY